MTVKNSNINDIVRKFLLKEWNTATPSIRSRFLALEEQLSSIIGRSLTEKRRLEIVFEQLKGLKKEVRRLEEQNIVLEEANKELQEKLTLLEENREE